MLFIALLTLVAGGLALYPAQAAPGSAAQAVTPAADPPADAGASRSRAARPDADDRAGPVRAGCAGRQRWPDLKAALQPPNSSSGGTGRR